MAAAKAVAKRTVAARAAAAVPKPDAKTQQLRSPLSPWPSRRFAPTGYRAKTGRYATLTTSSQHPQQQHYYEPRVGHGLRHSPFNAIVAPRPIGWIGSRSAEGHVNLAPANLAPKSTSRPRQASSTASTITRQSSVSPPSASRTPCATARRPASSRLPPSYMF